MTNAPLQRLSHPLGARLFHFVVNLSLVATVSVAIGAVAPVANAAGSDETEHSADPASQMQKQHISLIIQQKLRDARPEDADKAARGFLDHLQDSSPIAYEKLIAGQLDDDEVSSRIDVFIRDHPELVGQAKSAVVVSDPRARVAALLANERGVGASEAERLSAADKFIQRLGELSGEARNSLMSNQMADEDLASRVKVFAADLRAEASVVAEDPALAAVPPIVDSFVKKNIGRLVDRANSICYRGSVEKSGTTREFVIFKKRPRLIRIHIIENGDLTGVIGFDGTTVWRETKGEPAIPIVGSDADAVLSASRFDDPLVDFRERGAVVRLEDKPGADPIRLHIRDVDGTEMVSTLKSSDYSEISLRVHGADGAWVETRFRDYRKIGALNVPFIQEEWREGKLVSTTRISEVRLDPGLLDQFFAIPSEPYLGFMSYMDAIAAVRRQQGKAVATTTRQGGSP